LRFLGIILRVLRLAVSVFNVDIINQFETTFAGGVEKEVEMSLHRSRQEESILVGRLVYQGLLDKAMMAEPVKESSLYLRSLIELAHHARADRRQERRGGDGEDWLLPLSSAICDITEVMESVTIFPLTDDEPYKESM
jgi:hypothetical protein